MYSVLLKGSSAVAFGIRRLMFRPLYRTPSSAVVLLHALAMAMATHSCMVVEAL